jgi:hypothetical protein
MSETSKELTAAQQTVIDAIVKRREFLEPLFRSALIHAVLEGEVDPLRPPGAEAKRPAGRRRPKGQAPVSFSTDYRDSLLRLARVLRRQRDNWAACVLYAVWLEHFVNHLVIDLCHRQLSRESAAQVVRDLPIRAKLTWFPVTLGRKPLAKNHSTALLQLIDLRNEFVHYKWSHDPLANDDRADERLERVLQRIELSIRYLVDYHDRQVLKGSRRLFNKLARDLAEKELQKSSVHKA